MDFSTIDQIVKDFQYEYAGNIANSGHSASGDLALNQKYFLNLDNRYFTVTLQLEDYWKYLEYGRKPGKFPPPDAIKQWIQIKPILPRPMKNGKLPTTNQLAYLIGRKIATEGIKPTKLLEKTITEFELVNKVYNAFVEEFKKQIYDDKSA